MEEKFDSNAHYENEIAKLVQMNKALFEHAQVIERERDELRTACEALIAHEDVYERKYAQPDVVNRCCICEQYMEYGHGDDCPMPAIEAALDVGGE